MNCGYIANNSSCFKEIVCTKLILQKENCKKVESFKVYCMLLFLKKF